LNLFGITAGILNYIKIEMFDTTKQEELFQVESKPERPTSFSQLLTNRHRFPFDVIAWEEL
jgi:hypothetical protein